MQAAISSIRVKSEKSSWLRHNQCATNGFWPEFDADNFAQNPFTLLPRTLFSYEEHHSQCGRGHNRAGTFHCALTAPYPERCIPRVDYPVLTECRRCAGLRFADQSPAACRCRTPLQQG